MAATYKAAFPACGPAAWRADARPVYEGGGGASAPAFEGILDQLSTVAAAAWSATRRLTVDYEGPLVRVRRDSDNAESDFGWAEDDPLCVLDTAAITTWLAGANPFLAKVYSQVGSSRDLAQSTAGSQPALKLTGLGTLSRPWIDCLVSGGLRPLTATNAALDDLKSTGMSVHVEADPDVNVILYKGTQFSTGWSFDGGGTTLSFYIRGTGGTNWSKSGLIDGSAHSYTLTYDGGIITASAKLWFDGAAVSGFNNAGGGSTPFVSDAGTPMRVPASGNQGDAKHSTLVIFGGVLSDADALLLNADGKTFLNG